MAWIRLEQILSNLSYNTGSNVLYVSGSFNITQTNSNYSALTVSGSLDMANSPGISSGSITGSGNIDGGTF